jgi:serine/threonine protein kinase
LKLDNIVIDLDDFKLYLIDFGLIRDIGEKYKYIGTQRYFHPFMKYK